MEYRILENSLISYLDSWCHLLEKYLDLIYTDLLRVKFNYKGEFTWVRLSEKDFEEMDETREEIAGLLYYVEYEELIEKGSEQEKVKGILVDKIKEMRKAKPDGSLSSGLSMRLISNRLYPVSFERLMVLISGYTEDDEEPKRSKTSNYYPRYDLYRDLVSRETIEKCMKE